MTDNKTLVSYFNKLSDTYSVNEYASFFLTNYMRRKLIKKVNCFKNKSVLDIMSGKGENLKHITQDNTEISTVDFAIKMNEASRLKNKGIHQIQKDFFEMTNSNSFDIILCSFGIKTIEISRIETFAKKINNLLNKNGEILLLELVKPENGLKYKITKIYLKRIVPFFFGRQFKRLFPYVHKHKNMNRLKDSIIEENFEIIEHKRMFDLFEIIHAKKLNHHENKININ